MPFTCSKIAGTPICEDQIDRRLERGHPDVAHGAALEQVRPPPDGPVVAQEPRPAEQEGDRVLVAEPAGDVGAERVHAVRAHVEEARALEAHQPLVRAGREVVDLRRAGVDRHRAAALHGVDEDLRARAVAERGHGLDGHAQAALELDGAHRHEARAALELAPEGGQALLHARHEGGDRAPTRSRGRRPPRRAARA